MSKRMIPDIERSHRFGKEGRLGVNTADPREFKQPAEGAIGFVEVPGSADGRRIQNQALTVDDGSCKSRDHNGM